jgi:hypothetical protein
MGSDRRAGLLGQGTPSTKAVLRDKEHWTADLINLAASFSRSPNIQRNRGAQHVRRDASSAFSGLTNGKGLVMRAATGAIVRVNGCKRLLGNNPEQVDLTKLPDRRAAGPGARASSTPRSWPDQRVSAPEQPVVAVSRRIPNSCGWAGTASPCPGRAASGRTLPGRRSQAAEGLERIIGNDLNIRNVKQIIPAWPTCGCPS